MNWRSCARRPPIADAEARRPEDQQACAHLRVLYMTEQIEGGLTRGWWACDSCQTKFTPVALAEHAVAQAVEWCAKIAEGFESPFSQEFPTEAWRGKLQTVILQALLGAPKDGDDTQPERAVAEAVFSFLQTGRDRMDELFQTGSASAAIRAEARRREGEADGR
jgi:hypothetical protein